MRVSTEVLDSFHRVLLEEIRAKRPEYLRGPFTVAEIYQDLVPYPTHRDRIGVEMNGDYEDALIRLLAGEGGYLLLDSDHALRDLRTELQSRNPNTGIYREFAAVDVRLNPALVESSDAETAPVGVASGGAAPRGPAAPDSEAVLPVQPLGGAPDAGGVGAPAAAAASGPAAPGAEEACRWCRAPLPLRDDLNFCPFCGTDVRSVPCPGCGAEIQPEWRFCISCGSERSS